MRLKTSGEIGIEKKRHFALFDMEETLPNADAILKRMLRLGGAVLTQSKISAGYTAASVNVPSVWVNDGMERTGSTMIKCDVGLLFGAAPFSGRDSYANGNGYFTSPNWGYLKSSAQPAMMLPFTEKGSANNIYLQTYSLFDGMLLHCEHPYSKVSIYALFLNSGVMYLLHTNTAFNAPLGWLPENTLSFNLLDYLEPMRLYQVQSVPNVAHGTVYDAAGRPMAGCRVLAYERASGRLVGSAVSASDGKYECPILVARGEKIFLVCLDNDAAPDFDARIIDRVSV